MAAELKKLKATRAQIKGHVTRINTFLNTKQDITYEQAQSKYEKVQELWTSFNDTQTQIEVIRAQNDEQLEQITKEEKRERIVFEECYYKALDVCHHGSKKTTAAGSKSATKRAG